MVYTFLKGENFLDVSSRDLNYRNRKGHLSIKKILVILVSDWSSKCNKVLMNFIYSFLILFKKKTCSANSRAWDSYLFLFIWNYKIFLQLFQIRSSEIDKKLYAETKRSYVLSILKNVKIFNVDNWSVRKELYGR